MNSICGADCPNPFAHGPSLTDQFHSFIQWTEFEQRVFGENKSIMCHVNNDWQYSDEDNKVLHYIKYHMRNRSKYYYISFPEPAYFVITRRARKMPTFDFTDIEFSLPMNIKPLAFDH